MLVLREVPWEPKTFIFRGYNSYNPYIGGVKPFNFMGFGVPMVYHFCHTAPARILNNFVASMVGVLLFQVHDALRGFRGPERPKARIGIIPFCGWKKSSIWKNGGFIEINYVHIKKQIYLTLLELWWNDRLQKSSANAFHWRWDRGKGHKLQV